MPGIFISYWSNQEKTGFVGYLKPNAARMRAQKIKLVTKATSRGFIELTVAVTFVFQDKEEADRVMSQVKILIRPLYSNPPVHGARIVTEILSNPELKQLW